MFFLNATTISFLFCNNFLIYLTLPSERDISGEVLKEISSLNEKTMENIFELTASREQLKKMEVLETMSMNMLQQKEVANRDLMSSFSRFPKLVPANYKQ